ncbi:MAG: SusD/RagB family nutrient-binding outer membrane lipoprotein [Tenacibaculum sp.]|nr:SusD/RagB family nutrient-binding outer membrane lipoprotein [Tenacibaculum sp.]
MKNIFLKTLSVILLGAFVSCSYTDGINESPNDFTDSSAELLIGQASLEVTHLCSSDASRYAGMFTDQFVGADRQYISTNKYSVTSGDFNGMWQNIYVSGLDEANLAEQKARKDGNKVLEGVAQIHKAILFGETTALWGDIPFSQALDNEKFPKPKYDKQSEVLKGVQGLLDKAIANVGSLTVEGAYGGKVFGNGSTATWKEIAHSLKARYYLIAKDYSKALEEAKKGISATANDWVSVHSSADGAQNLYYQFVALNRSGYLKGKGSHLYKLINDDATDGERKLATPGNAKVFVKYFNEGDLNTTENGVFAVNAGTPIISFVETKLIEAEAAARTGGDATTPFNAVRDELANIYKGDFPHTTSTGNDLLLEILEEKYIALIGSLQVFHDVRRTDNAIGVPVKSSTAPSLPQRFLYPQSEINSNKANVPNISDVFKKTEVNE